MLHNSFLAYLAGESKWLVDHVQQLELEVRGVPWDYNWWQLVHAGLVTVESLRRGGPIPDH
jgi:hypothetical protein